MGPLVSIKESAVARQDALQFLYWECDGISQGCSSWKFSFNIALKPPVALLQHSF